MTAPLARCHCATCCALDRLPLRRHGIPGAYQLTFAHHASGSGPELVYDASGAVCELVAMTDREIADWHPRGPQRLPDTLPLFLGALEPTLF